MSATEISMASFIASFEAELPTDLSPTAHAEVVTLIAQMRHSANDCREVMRLLSLATDRIAIPRTAASRVSP